VSEQIRWSTINLGGSIEALHANYALRYSFEPHWHEEFAVGLIESGVVQLRRDGKTEHITTDKVIIVNAGEIHSADGFGTPSLRIRKAFIPESSFREVVSQRTKLPGSLYFSQTVLSDPTMSRDLSKALRILDSDASLLAKQGMLLNIMAAVIRRFSSWSGVIDGLAAPSALDRAREYLHDRISDGVSLDDLGRETGLTKFHLLRAFRNRFGLPPHAYQLRQRVLQAKRLLKSFSPSYVALECGFSDQSHFTRVFRAHTGTTPRRYAEQFRPIRADNVACSPMTCEEVFRRL
jgi:AraC-like DNA-binding protein/mannose-6-phosphate isomerase-like protein (cupin superfamily)